MIGNIKNTIVFYIGLMLFISCADKNNSNSAIDILQAPPNEIKCVLPLDKEWEKSLSFPCMVQKPDGQYILYYGARTNIPEMPYVTCVVLTEDGLVFEKPDLDCFYWDGKKSNIISTEFENVTVYYSDGVYYLVGFSQYNRGG